MNISDAPAILTIAELTDPAVKDSAVLSVSDLWRKVSMISVASSMMSGESVMFPYFADLKADCT